MVRSFTTRLEDVTCASLGFQRVSELCHEAYAGGAYLRPPWRIHLADKLGDASTQTADNGSLKHITMKMEKPELCCKGGELASDMSEAWEDCHCLCTIWLGASVGELDGRDGAHAFRLWGLDLMVEATM